MDDIVEDLRATADDADAVENASVARLLEKAAGEIARLRLTSYLVLEPPPLRGLLERTSATHATPVQGSVQGQ